jgi:SAM-dependent methyltransferase
LKPDLSLTHLEEERVVPWGNPGLFAWHRARYQFALALVQGKRVLDLGSGEGYGAALLAERAREVIGVDYAPAAVDHASSAYRRANLTFVRGDAGKLDPALGPFDVITCFEVIEHLAGQESVLKAISAALAPTGLLVLSTPNKSVEAPFERFVSQGDNQYHIGLLAPGDLRGYLRNEFRHVTLYGQSPDGNALYLVLKSLDPFNLRHRLVRSLRVQRSLATTVMGQDWRAEEMSFRFSRLLVRQSPITVATASGPIAIADGEHSR